jgi:serine phosphatase RsbU (regulator of sigma subunit)
MNVFFITAAYYLIDTHQKRVEYVRAGHCPSIHYCNKEQSFQLLETKGMGLGMLRNSDYEKYVHSNAFNYQSEDILLLYTDGITEATDSNKSQFGEQGILKSLENQTSKEPEDIMNGLVEDLYQFLNGKKLDDDYTMLIIKFK